MPGNNSTTFDPTTGVRTSSHSSFRRFHGVVRTRVNTAARWTSLCTGLHINSYMIYVTVSRGMPIAATVGVGCSLRGILALALSVLWPYICCRRKCIVRAVNARARAECREMCIKGAVCFKLYREPCETRRTRKL